MPLTQVSAGDRINAADLNQFYNLLKGVAASGEAVTLIYNAAGAVILQPSSDPAAATEAVQIKNNAGTVQSALSFDGRFYAADGLVGTPGMTFEQDKDTGLYRISANSIGFATSGTLRATLDTTALAMNSLPVRLAKGADIASSGTTDLSTATGNYVQISGTTTITAFGTVQAGTVMVLEFQGALTLTYNATSLILKSAANATTAAGDIYWFVSEGAGNWREVGHLTGTGSGTADYVQLSQSVLGGAAATISFTSISGSYRNLQILLQGRGDTAATSVIVNMQFNADTGANYDSELIQINADTAALGPASGAQTLAGTVMGIGQIAAASSTASVADALRIDIPNYVGTTFQKTAISQGSIKLGTAAGNVYLKLASGWWRSTAAITQVDLKVAAGNFAAGTVATLYGLR